MNINLISQMLAYAVLLVIGYFDLRYREVKYEWLYIIFCIFGTFTGTPVVEKIICLVVLPFIVVGVACIIGKKKGVDAISLIGGADVKTIACVGYSFGMVPLAFATLFSLIASIPFIKNHTLGMKNKPEEGAEPIGIPFCSAITLGIGMLYILMLILMCIRQQN